MKSILKSIGIGILIGALSFFAFNLIITFFIIGAIMMLLRRRRRFERPGFGLGRFGAHRFAFADKIRNMDEEEYTAFKSNFENSHCRNYRSERNNTQTK